MTGDGRYFGSLAFAKARPLSSLLPPIPTATLRLQGYGPDATLLACYDRSLRSLSDRTVGLKPSLVVLSFSVEKERTKERDPVGRVIGYYVRGRGTPFRGGPSPSHSNDNSNNRKYRLS